VESSEPYRAAIIFGATGGLDGFRITPSCVTSMRAPGYTAVARASVPVKRGLKWYSSLNAVPNCPFRAGQVTSRFAEMAWRRYASHR
jgi:hypothetical protein